jgi:hypothetical protein
MSNNLIEPVALKSCIAAIALFAYLGIGAWPQSGIAFQLAPTTTWSVPRTDGGAPDFQGATWTYATMTPLERAEGIAKPILTADEAASYERQIADRQTATTNNGYDWWDDGAAHLDRGRTSLIIDPSDGHLPPLTADAQRHGPIARPLVPEGPEDLPLNTRCIWWQNAGPPLIPSPYNNNLQFIQTRDRLVIFTENIHDARIVPMDHRPHGTVRQWMGDSRGRWDGDTLVVDTINFSAKTSLRGSDENLHIEERFTRVDANTIEYRFTADDPTVWTRPWTAGFPLRRTTEMIYEFACHEGNALIMEGILKATRFLKNP